ncbi:MAG: hypothetical protein K5784_01125 [Clostridiales bacterium]|nr:hypothetical protein [Clostridiales bacterium]
MKKLLAVLLSLCMLLGMAGVAEGGKITAQATYQGNSLADIIATWNTDEDGCTQLGVNGNVMDTALNLLAQIGSSSIVIASGDEAYEITAENLGTAIYNTGVKYLGEETMKQFVALVQYMNSEDYQQDMAVLSQVAQNELMKLMQTAMENGLFAQTESGIVIDINNTNLPAFLKDYAAAAANDANLFAALSGTKFWSIMGLSEGGKDEQAMVAQIASSIPDDLGAEFYLYAEINNDNTFWCRFTADIEGQAVVFDAEFDGEELSAYGKVSQGERELMYCSLDVESDGSMSFELNTPALKYAYELEVDGSEVSVSYKLEQITGGYRSQKVEVRADVDTEAYSANFNVEATEENLATNKKYSEVNVYGDVNLMSTEWLNVTAIVKSGASEIEMAISGTTEQTEEGAALCVKFDVRDGEEWHYDALNATLSVGNTFKLHSHLNNWNANGEYQVYTLDAELDPATMKLDAVLTAGEASYILAGSLDEDSVYRMTLSAKNGEYAMELGKASLAIDMQRGLPYSLLMGEFNLSLYDGTSVTRTSELTETGLTWTITVTSNGQTQTYLVGIRQIADEEGQTGIEAFLNQGGMEIAAGAKYKADGTTYKGEIYLTQSMGAYYQADMFRLKLGYEPITEPAAHITGAELPVEAIEQILDQIIQSIG